VTLAAIVGHADDAGLLRRNLEHHLAVGFDRIFVSMNDGDGASWDVARQYSDSERVRAMAIDELAADPLDYFEAATDVVRGWCAAEWVAYIDTDEFWLPQSGQMQATVGLQTHDLIRVPRFNAAVVRDRDGLDVEPDLARLLLVKSLGGTQPERLAEGEPYVRSPIATKLLVRPDVVDAVGRGGHDIVHRGSEPLVLHPVDLLVAHLPFTSIARFRRKVGAVKSMLRTHGHRGNAHDAAHWRMWLELEDDHDIEREFGRNVVRADEVVGMLRAGVLSSPRGMYGSAVAAS
jgi:hypothetical protein